MGGVVFGLFEWGGGPLQKIIRRSEVKGQEARGHRSWGKEVRGQKSGVKCQSQGVKRSRVKRSKIEGPGDKKTMVKGQEDI